MRVTESRILDITSNAISTARDRSASITEKMSSGVAVTKPSDGLAAWTEAQRVDVRSAMSTQRGNAINTATDNLTQTDTALSAIYDALNSARTLATQAANGTISADQRAAAAVQINALRDTIVGQANTKSSDGEYLLAGSQGGLVPFDSLGNYYGDSKTRSISTSESALSVGQISGSVLTSASGVNVIGVLNTLSAALASNNQAGITSSLTDLQTAVSQVSIGRQTVGDAMTTLQSANDARSAFELQLSSRKSDLTSQDTVSGATELANAKNQLDAANAVAAEVVQMTAPNRTS